MRFAISNGEAVVSIVDGDGAEGLPGAVPIPEALAGYPIDRLVIRDGQIVPSPESVNDPARSETR
ncbi:hypothetical protein [Fodinicurvata sp. EGI_FJ10296]|uniref:hypothetical protein n=1 Tax=Fodinicurvata sp. EGI_FJ10296 TaxID=3231908 RepID=UPI003453A64D